MIWDELTYLFEEVDENMKNFLKVALMDECG